MYRELIAQIETLEYHGDELLPVAALEPLCLQQDTLAEALAALGYQGPQRLNTDVPDALYYARPLGVAASLSTKGHKAAVALPRFGQAHQQYFTPVWIAQAMALITRRLYQAVQWRKLLVLDPTAGSGRLLAPFAAVGHQCVGIELDARLKSALSRAIAKCGTVLTGDILQYAPLLAECDFNVVATNPPYGLQWPVPKKQFDLAQGTVIESQSAVLEISRSALDYEGLLIGVFSGRFWETQPKALAYLNKHFQVVCRVTLPQPFRPEYGIGVNASFVVAIAKSDTTERSEPAPMTGVWQGGENAKALADAVAEAFKKLKSRRGDYKHYKDGVRWLYPYEHKLPDIPELPSVTWLDGTLAATLTRRGLSPNSDAARLWARYLEQVPVYAYNEAQGTLTDAVQAYGSLPNVLSLGVEQARAGLESVGFSVVLSEADTKQLEIAAKKWAYINRPLRALTSQELLGYFPTSVTAQKTVTVPASGASGADGKDVRVPEGASYRVASRWERTSEQAKVEKKEKGKQTYTERTYIDRGYLVLRFTPDDPANAAFSAKEPEPEQVKAIVEAFGLPVVELAEDNAAVWTNWEKRVDRVAGILAERTKLRMYDWQVEDVVRFCLRRHAANLDEQGSGKTVQMAAWAFAQDRTRVLWIAPASVVPGIIEDLGRWGFRLMGRAHARDGDKGRLTHAKLTAIKRERRIYREVWNERRRLKQQMPKLERLRQHYEWLMRQEETDWRYYEKQIGLITEKAVRLLQYNRLEDARAEFARKRRHLKALHEIAARLNKDLTGEITQCRTEVEKLWASVRRQEQDLGLPPDNLLLCSDGALVREPVFLVGSYEDLGLGDGRYDPWDNEHYDREGGYINTTHHITSASCPDCKNGSGKREKMVTACPQCGAAGSDWHSDRGSAGGGGRFCRKCGYRAWTEGALLVRPVRQYEARLKSGEKTTLKLSVVRAGKDSWASLAHRWYGDDDLALKRLIVTNHLATRQKLYEHLHQRERQHRIIQTEPDQLYVEYLYDIAAQSVKPASAIEPDTAVILPPYVVQADRHIPLGPRMKRAFTCIVLDEVQDAKSRGTLKGQCSRSLRARGRAIASGTWMKGYITDLFFTAGWVFGFDSPAWPFPYTNTSGFVGKFGTFKYISREYEETLEIGDRRPIPSVSNTTLLWKMLAPFCIRRTKAEMMSDLLPPKTVSIEWVEMDSDQAAIYEAISTAAESLINRELTKENPDIGVISAALWWTRFAATVPNADGAIHYARACGIDIENTNDLDAGQRAEVIAEMQKDDMLVAGSWAKLDKAMELILAFARQGNKVIVFTGLKAMYKAVLAACKERGIGVTGLGGTTTQARNGVCRMFEADPTKTVLLAGTGMLNRGVTVNGANHVIILDLDWNPETTRQAEDRCHRPGQTKDVTVHYILTANTSDEQMWEVVTAKARAQRQVLDHEMIYQSTADLLHSAASAQLQVARALLSKKRYVHHHGGDVELVEVSGGEGGRAITAPLVIDVPGSAVALPQQLLVAKAPGNVVNLSLSPNLPVEAETVWGEDHEAQASRLVFGQISLSLATMPRARRKKAIPEAQMTLL